MSDSRSVHTARIFVPAATALLLALSGQPLANADAETERVVTERFFANAVPPESFGVGRQAVEVRIQRWSTDEEHEEIVGLLNADGARRLGRRLRRMDVTGSIRPRGRSPWNFRYARETRDGDNRHIVLIADRRIEWGGMSRRGQRDTGFQTSLVILDLGKDDVGRGEMIAGIQVGYDEEAGHLVPANRLVDPVDLADVRTRQ